MDDHEAPAETQDTPPETGPDNGTPGNTDTEQVNWQKRYEDLRSDYDRKTPLAAQWERFESDEDYRDALLAQLGYEIEPEDEFDPDDDDDPTDTRLSQLEHHIASREQAEQEERAIEQIEMYVNAQLDAINGLDQADRDWVESRALTIDPTPDGMPDIKTAFEQLQARDIEAQKRWAKTKTSPRFSQNGQPGSQAPNTLDMTDDQLADLMVERMQMME